MSSNRRRNFKSKFSGENYKDSLFDEYLRKYEENKRKCLAEKKDPYESCWKMLEEFEKLSKYVEKMEEIREENLKRQKQQRFEDYLESYDLLENDYPIEKCNRYKLKFPPESIFFRYPVCIRSFIEQVYPNMFISLHFREFKKKFREEIINDFVVYMLSESSKHKGKPRFLDYDNIKYPHISYIHWFFMKFKYFTKPLRNYDKYTFDYCDIDVDILPFDNFSFERVAVKKFYDYFINKIEKGKFPKEGTFYKFGFKILLMVIDGFTENEISSELNILLPSTKKTKQRIFKFAKEYFYEQ